MLPGPTHSRRTAVVLLCSTVLSLGLPRLLRATPIAHPKPRAGITGSRVATAEQLTNSPDLVALFNEVRALPQVIDGIRCHCGCADFNGHYSLLTCYEGADAMAKSCPICQGMGRVAVRMHKAGKSLDEIRVAVDAQFG